MQCFSCGRQSSRNDYCEWCRRPHGRPGQMPPNGAPPGAQPTQPLPPGAQPTMQMQPGAQPTMQMQPGAQPTMQMPPPATTRRVALTGEVVEGPAPPPPQPTQAMPPHAYGNAPLPPRAYSAQAIQLDFDEIAPVGERWEKALAFCFSLAAFSMLLIHFAPGAFLWVAYADMFLLMLALGATRAIPFFEEAMLDCGIMLLVCFLFGPIIALVVYLIVGAIKQECNGAIVTLLIVSIVLPQLLALPVIHSADSINPFLLLSLFGMLSFLAVFVGFLGWLCASFFRPLNE